MIHILDWIMYFVLFALIWKFMEWIGDGGLTEEIGGMFGSMIMILFTILYCITFYYYDWVNISEWIHNIPVTL